MKRYGTIAEDAADILDEAGVDFILMVSIPDRHGMQMITSGTIMEFATLLTNGIANLFENQDESGKLMLIAGLDFLLKHISTPTLIALAKEQVGVGLRKEQAPPTKKAMPSNPLISMLDEFTKKTKF